MDDWDGSSSSNGLEGPLLPTMLLVLPGLERDTRSERGDEEERRFHDGPSVVLIDVLRFLLSGGRVQMEIADFGSHDSSIVVSKLGGT